MPSQFPLPSWLETRPDDIANKFATGVQIGAQLGEAKNRLAQQAQQSAVENQVTQDRMMASALQSQQELQVKKAYEDQQVSLAQQKIQAAQAKVGLETAKAARQFQAQQAYQRDYQAGIDMDLTPDEAARASYFKNLVQSGSPASVASAMRPSASAKDTTLKLQNVGGQDFAVGSGGAFKPIKSSDAQVPSSILTQATTKDGKPVAGVYFTPKGGVVKTAGNAAQTRAAIKDLESGPFGVWLISGSDPDPNKITPEYKAAKARYQALKSGASAPSGDNELKIKSITTVDNSQP